MTKSPITEADYVYLEDQIAELQIKVMDLKWEANFWRAGTLIAFVFAAGWLWERFF